MVTLRTTGGIAGILTRPPASGMIWICRYRNVRNLHVTVDMQDVKAEKKKKNNRCNERNLGVPSHGEE